MVYAGGVQPEQATAKTYEYAELDRRLHTLTGFEKYVDHSRISDAFMYLFVTIGVFMLLTHVGVTWSWLSSHGISHLRLPVYLVSLLGGGDSLVRFIPLGLAVVCFLAAGAFHLFSQLTSGRAWGRLYKQFCQSGFLARVSPTSVTVEVPGPHNSAMAFARRLYVLIAADEPSDHAMQAVRHIESASGPQGHRNDEYVHVLMTATDHDESKAVLGSSFDAALATDIYVTVSEEYNMVLDKGDRHSLCIAIPDDTNKTMLRLYDLKTTKTSAYPPAVADGAP